MVALPTVLEILAHTVVQWPQQAVLTVVVVEVVVLTQAEKILQVQAAPE
jgi:hypothetical protein